MAKTRKPRERVDWASLRTIDGKDGKRIQRILRDLEKPDDKGEFAKGKIFDALVGTRPKTVLDAKTCSASPPTLKALIQLAADASMPERHDLLQLAHELLRFGHAVTDEDLPRGYDRARSPWREAWATELGGALHAAARESVPALVSLLDDADPRVRANAIALLGSISDGAAEIAPLLSAHLEKETSPAVGASATIALYYTARYLEAKPDLDAALASPHAIVRGMAQTVSMLFDEAPTADFETTFREMLLGFAEFGTKPGRPAELLEPYSVFGWDFIVHYWAIYLLGERRELRPTIVDAILDAARELQGKECGILQGQIVMFALRWNLPRREDLVAPSDLSSEQLALLARLSEIDTQGPFKEYGLSPEVRSRRRQLGFDPPGPLERIVTVDGVTAPIWRMLITLRHEREPREESRVVHDKLVRSAPELRPRDWLAVWFEADGTKLGRQIWYTTESRQPYGVLWNYDSDWMDALFARTPDDERIAWAKTYHTELRRWPNLFRGAGCLLVRELFVRPHPDETLPEEYEADIGLGFRMPVREVLERIPEARLVRLLRRLVESGEIDMTQASAFLDLAPDLLPVLYERIERAGVVDLRGSEGKVFNDGGAFLHLLERDPRVRRVHDEYMARLQR